MESHIELKKQIEELKTLNRDLKEDFQHMEVYKNEQKAKVSNLEEKLKEQWWELKQLDFELREERKAKETAQNEKAECDQLLDNRVLSISSLTEEMNQLANDKNIEIENLKEVVGAREKTVSNLESQVKDLQTKESASEQKIRDLEAEHVENIKKLQGEHSMKMSEQDEKVKSLEEEINVQKQQMDKANADLEAADENVKALKEQLAEFERAKKEKEDLENAELKELKERLERLQQTNGELDERLKKAEQNENANKNLIARIRGELESASQKNEDLTSELSQATQELKVIETQLGASQTAKLELEGKLRVEDENVKALNVRIADLLKDLQTQESASEQKIRALAAEHVEKIKKIQDEHSMKITEQVEKIKSLEEEMKAQKEKSDKASEDLEAAGEKIRELSDAATNREAQLLEKQIAIHELEEKLNLAEKNVKKLQLKNQCKESERFERMIPNVRTSIGEPRPRNQSGESSLKRSGEESGGPLAKVQKTQMATDAPGVQAQLITAPVTVRKLIVIKPAPITIERPAAAVGQSQLVPAPPAKHQPVQMAIRAPVAPADQLQAIPEPVQIQIPNEALAAPSGQARLAPALPANRQPAPITTEIPTAPIGRGQLVTALSRNRTVTVQESTMIPPAPITIESSTAPVGQAQLVPAPQAIPEIVQIQNGNEALAAPGDQAPLAPAPPADRQPAPIIIEGPTAPDGQAQLAPAPPTLQEATNFQTPLPQMNLAAHLEAPSAQDVPDIVMQPIVNQPAPGPQLAIPSAGSDLEEGAPKKMHHKTAKKLKKDQAVAKRKQTIAEKKGALQ